MIAEQLDKALTNASVFTDPFRVHYFTPFSDSLYQEILAHLPENRFYQEMEHPDALRDDGTSTRLVMVLKDERIKALPEVSRTFWRDLAAEFSGKAVREVFRKHLAPELIARFKLPLDQIPLIPQPMLIRDITGYKIGPHPDTPLKACTIQCYLPPDDKQSYLGTTFYRKTKRGLELVRTLDYLPNKAYCFTVTESSWHGTMFGGFVRPRDSLMLTYFVKPYDRY